MFKYGAIAEVKYVHPRVYLNELRKSNTSPVLILSRWRVQFVDTL